MNSFTQQKYTDTHKKVQYRYRTRFATTNTVFRFVWDQSIWIKMASVCFLTLRYTKRKCKTLQKEKKKSLFALFKNRMNIPICRPISMFTAFSLCLHNNIEDLRSTLSSLVNVTWQVYLSCSYPRRRLFGLFCSKHELNDARNGRFRKIMF